jgi:hypothetical protein
MEQLYYDLLKQIDDARTKLQVFREKDNQQMIDFYEGVVLARELMIDKIKGYLE